MSLETLRPSPAFRDVLPVEYKDLVAHGPYTNRNGSEKQTVKVKDMGKFKEVIQNAVHIAREVGPTFVQLYTPCILEIGKQSMEGLDEMKDSEQIGGRFVPRTYVTDEAQIVIDRLKQEKKERKKAARKPKKVAVPA